tara:strand:+ start:3781 stop:5067 length:1287 start_codon:yes stop_codon:yes gene_type:complete
MDNTFKVIDGDQSKFGKKFSKLINGALLVTAMGVSGYGGGLGIHHVANYFSKPPTLNADMTERLSEEVEYFLGEDVESHKRSNIFLINSNLNKLQSFMVSGLSSSDDLVIKKDYDVSFTYNGLNYHSPSDDSDISFYTNSAINFSPLQVSNIFSENFYKEIENGSLSEKDRVLKAVNEYVFVHEYMHIYKPIDFEGSERNSLEEKLKSEMFADFWATVYVIKSLNKSGNEELAKPFMDGLKSFRDEGIKEKGRVKGHRTGFIIDVIENIMERDNDFLNNIDISLSNMHYIDYKLRDTLSRVLIKEDGLKNNSYVNELINDINEVREDSVKLHVLLVVLDEKLGGIDKDFLLSSIKERRLTEDILRDSLEKNKYVGDSGYVFSHNRYINDIESKKSIEEFSEVLMKGFNHSNTDASKQRIKSKMKLKKI